MQNKIFISACAGVLLGLLLTRKRGPFNIFRLLKNNGLLNIVLRCETCATVWISFIVFVGFGIIPTYQFFIELLATGGLALAIAAIAQSFVQVDEDEEI